MKTIINYRKIFFTLLTISIMTWLVACNKDNNDMNNNDTVTISGTASGSKEIPSNTTAGSATLSGTYTKSTNTLSYTINWSGLTGNLTAAHFHGPASITETASPMVTINF